MIRRIVSWKPDPARPGRRLFKLSCGHRVSRRPDNAKQQAYCGHCEALRTAPDDSLLCNTLHYSAAWDAEIAAAYAEAADQQEQAA